MEEKEIPKLEDGEEIVYLTKAISFLSGNDIFCIILFIIIFFGFIIDFSVNEIFFILYILGIFLLICLGIYIGDAIEKGNKTLYYLTTKRVIRIVGNGFFPHKPKQDEINLDDIAYIEDYDGIWIVQKGINGELHYTGEETEIFEDLPKDVKTMQFNLVGKEAQKIIKIIIKKFLEILPAIQHPNLKVIYLNTR